MRTACLSTFIALAFYSCAGKSEMKLDLSKIRPWSTNLSDPLPPPYVVDFEFGAKALTFVAVQHSNESSSPSIKLVGDTMDTRRFSAVVLEGFPRSQGLSPFYLKDEAAKDGANGFYKNGETSIAVQKAVKKAVPYVGGEPEESVVRAAALAAGFNENDLFCFYIVRQVPQWRRDGTFMGQSFEERYSQMAAALGSRLGFSPGKEPSLEFFHKWYQAKMGKPFRAREVSTEMVAPIASGEFLTQRISSIVGRVRNEHIVRVTEEMLNLYGRVLVVYGASHFPMQQLAFESMLGKPARIADHP